MRKEKHFEERTSIFTNVSVQDELKKVRDSSQNSDHLAGSSKFGSIRHYVIFEAKDKSQKKR
jgi:hypothetical protein